MKLKLITVVTILSVFLAPIATLAEEALTSTATHPFWVTNRDVNGDGRLGEWVAAADLQTGDQVRLADGGEAVLEHSVLLSSEPRALARADDPSFPSQRGTENRQAKTKKALETLRVQRTANGHSNFQLTSAIRSSPSASSDSRTTTSDEQTTTYNFEVADSHTYFVGPEGLWVHNTCPVVIDAHFTIAYRQSLLINEGVRPEWAGWKERQRPAYAATVLDLIDRGHELFVTPSLMKELRGTRIPDAQSRLKQMSWRETIRWIPDEIGVSQLDPGFSGATIKSLERKLRRVGATKYDARHLAQAALGQTPDGRPIGYFYSGDMGLVWAASRLNPAISARSPAHLTAIYHDRGFPLRIPGREFQVSPVSVTRMLNEYPEMWIPGFDDFIYDNGDFLRFINGNGNSGPFD